MDVARNIGRGELVEAELDALVRRRHEKRVESEGERQAQEMYAESVRRYEENRRRLNAAAWYDYHQCQAARHRAVLEVLIGHHETQAARYREDGHNNHEKE